MLYILFMVHFASRSMSHSNGEIKWERFDVTFEVKAPLLLNVKGVANRNELQQVCSDFSHLCVFFSSSPDPFHRRKAFA